MKKLLILVLTIFCTSATYADDNTRRCDTSTGGSETGKCDGLRHGDHCESRIRGAKNATCRPGCTVDLTCTATECEDGWYLWVHKGASQGICRTEQDAKNYCDNPRYCKTRNCKPIFEQITHPTTGKTIWANTGCQEKIPERITPAETPVVKTPINPTPVDIPPISEEETPQNPEQQKEEPKPKNKTVSITTSCESTYNCRSINIFEEIDKVLAKHFTSSYSDVWKNDDGEFNTARLVSDSIAGVVLGTTGGIITSKIIKKNQLKRGFEDLKCTIGGQDVANYGDEFNVGLK